MTNGPNRRDELARRAFETMSNLVLDNDRRREVTDKVGLSFARLRVLRRIVGAPIAMGDLAALLNVDPPNLTALIADLEQLGLVRRNEHASDRRVKLVTTTPKGTKMARQAQAILDRPPAGLTALDVEDLETLNQILTTILSVR